MAEDLEKFANDLPNYLVKPLTFIGAVIISFTDWLKGKSVMRWNDFIDSARKCGASALPIVTLISFLTGLTMAFVGSVQLEKFNAKIYVADLVSLAMVREMGALMVGIIMAGRTGASFAAELGNMKLNEEIDSLRTFGISPISFLVLPRCLALFIMTPLLTLYADIVGILGGLTVATAVIVFSDSLLRANSICSYSYGVTQGYKVSFWSDNWISGVLQGHEFWARLCFIGKGGNFCCSCFNNFHYCNGRNI